MLPADLESKRIDFLNSDYELKVGYLSDQFTRMWTRFHFFLVVESGLFAALWWWLNNPLRNWKHGLLVASVGALSSCFWYIAGAQDKYLVEVYRTQARDAGRAIAEGLGIPVSPTPESDPSGSEFVHTGYSKTEIPKHVYQWRCEPVSTTKLAAWFPLVITVFWAIIILVMVL